MSGIASFIFAAVEHIRGKKTESRAFLAVGVICLTLAFDQAWQDEHNNVKVLIGDKGALSQERDFWKDQSYDKDASLRSRDEMLTKNYGVLAETQSSLAALSNRLVGLQEPLKITPHFIGLVPSQVNTNIQARYHGTFLVLTNKPITPVRLLVTCDAEILSTSGGVLGTAGGMGGGWGGRVTSSNKQFGVGILSPAWTPVNPLLVTIYTNESDAGNCSFDEK